MRGVLGASEPFISPPLLFAGRGAAVRGGAAVMPRRFFASEYWRAVTATLRLRASALTLLNDRVGAFRSHPSINMTVSAEDIDDGEWKSDQASRWVLPQMPIGVKSTPALGLVPLFVSDRDRAGGEWPDRVYGIEMRVRNKVASRKRWKGGPSRLCKVADTPTQSLKTRKRASGFRVGWSYADRLGPPDNVRRWSAALACSGTVGSRRVRPDAAARPALRDLAL